MTSPLYLSQSTLLRYGMVDEKDEFAVMPWKTLLKDDILQELVGPFALHYLILLITARWCCSLLSLALSLCDSRPFSHSFFLRFFVLGEIGHCF